MTQESKAEAAVLFVSYSDTINYHFCCVVLVTQDLHWFVVGGTVLHQEVWITGGASWSLVPTYPVLEVLLIQEWPQNDPWKP